MYLSEIVVLEGHVSDMPISKRWSRFNWDRLDEVLDVYGVYELADANDYTVYIGSGHLHERLQYWKGSGNPCIRQARKFRYEELLSDRRRRQRERALLKEFKKIHGTLPRCNRH